MTLGIIMVPEQKKQPHGEESGAASSAESVVSDAVVSTLTGQEFYSGLPPPPLSSEAPQQWSAQKFSTWVSFVPQIPAR